MLLKSNKETRVSCIKRMCSYLPLTAKRTGTIQMVDVLENKLWEIQLR